MGSIHDLAKSVIADGPSTNPTQISKSDLRAIFAAVDAAIARGYAGPGNWKTSVDLCATGNIALTGTVTVDGVTSGNGKRILAPLQSLAATRGIYLSNSGGAWTRVTDADTVEELIGASVYVKAGSTLAGSAWTCNNTTDDLAVLGTDAVTFAQIPGLSAVELASTSILDSTTVGRALLTAPNVSAQLTELGLSEQQKQGSTLVVADTMDLGAATGEFVVFGGSGATISSLGTAAAGKWRWVYFGGGSSTLMHDNIALRLPGNQNIATQTGDRALFVSVGAGNWVCLAYSRHGDVLLKSLIDLLAPMASPTFTGIPIAPTAAPGTNNNQISTTAFVQAAISSLVASSPSALNTLNELAAALGNDPNFATTIMNALAAKAPIANPAFTGVPQMPTAALGTNTDQGATTAFVQAAFISHLADFLQSQGRPGDATSRFTSTLTGEADVGAPPFGQLADGTEGKGFHVTGADVMALRERIHLRHGQKIRLTWGAERITDPSDPNGDTVRFDIQFMTSTKADNGRMAVPIDFSPLFVADGPQTVSKVVSRDAGTGVDIVAPEGTVYLSHLIETFGSNGVTNRFLLDWQDITYGDNAAAAIAADIADLAGDVAALDSAALHKDGDETINNVKTFSASPIVPTLAPGTNTDQAASAAFVRAAIDMLLSGAPGALDTLNELAAALGDDANFAATVTNALALKANDADVIHKDSEEFKGKVTGAQILPKDGFAPISGDSDNGIPVLFFDREGAVNVPRLREAANPKVVRQGIVGGIHDQEGNVAIGVTSDGTVAMFGEASLPFAYIADDGNGVAQVWIDHNDQKRQVTFGEVDVIACRAFAPGKVRYVVNDPVDGRSSRIVTFDPEVIAPSSLGTTSELLGTKGQSNGVGACSVGTEHVYTVANPHPQILMFNGGMRPRDGIDAMLGAGVPPAAFVEADLSSLVPAVEDFKIAAESETHCTSAALGYLSRAHNFNRRVTVFSSAVGSAAYADIKKGTQPYADFLLAVEKFAEIEAAASRTPTMRFVLNRHGESNISASQATYAGYLNEWIADLRTDCAAFIADAATMTMIVDQVGWPIGGTGNNLSAVALAQLERGTTAGTGIVCIGPAYWAPYVNIHMSPLGHRRWGDMAAKFMSRLSRGQTARPLYAKSAIRLSATSFLLDYDPDYPIVYDNTLVSDPGGAGVRIIDTGSVVINCSFDRIIDGRYAKFRMTSAPADGTPTVQIAGHGFNALPGPTTGLRANIRDTDPYRSPIDGAPLYNWACHQAFDLPAP